MLSRGTLRLLCQQTGLGLCSLCSTSHHWNFKFRNLLCVGVVQVELLLASGANGAAKNSNDQTPMDLAT